MKTAVRLLPTLLCTAIATAVVAAAPAANDPMLGHWTLSQASIAAHPDVLNEMSVSAVAGGYDMRVDNKGFPAAGVMHYVLDGKPHPFVSVSIGSEVPPGHPTSTCTRTQPRVITCLLADEGQPSMHSTITLSADGKTLTVDGAVYVRP